MNHNGSYKTSKYRYHEHHDHPASPEISVAHHAQENDQHQGDSSGIMIVVITSTARNLAAASHHDGLTTHPTADSESDSPAISEPTPAVKNDFTDEIALPGEQNAKTEEVPLSKSHPQIESVSEASPISSDLIDDSNILKQKSSEISEPSVELTLELQRASEVVRAASPTQQAAFIKTIPDYAFAKILEN
uniref:Uncharacterized protein n=1 Tax=Ditylenchus dipsaci TaxID=166011 RepID=A0A915CNW0_9BILA